MSKEKCQELADKILAYYEKELTELCEQAYFESLVYGAIAPIKVEWNEKEQKIEFKKSEQIAGGEE